MGGIGMENANIKNTINIIYMVCDTLNSSYDLGNASVREIMRMDFLKFILYLGASDNEISQEEVAFIAEYLDWDLSISQWNEFIDDQDLRSNSILSDIPLTLRIFVDADNKAYARDNSIMNVCEKYISIFEMLGKVFIGSDNRIDGREQIALEKYVSMIQKYYEENTKRKNEPDDENISIELEEGTIVISAALPETIKRMQELLPIKDEIIKKIERECNKYDPNDTFASPSSFYGKVYEIIQNCLDRYEEKLCNEFGKKFVLIMPQDYVSKYRTVCGMANKKLSNRWESYTEMTDLGRRVAEEQAAKEIKGMGFGVITNSMSSALLYTGMSAITYASQAKKAQDVYDKNIDIYRRSAGGDPRNYEMQMMREEVFPLVYPVVEKTVALYLNEVLDEISSIKSLYYEKLSDTHKTHNLASKDGYIYGDTVALRKALKDLKGISNSLDNYDKILKILQECPYCPEVYFKLIKIGKYDKKVFGIAQTMHLAKIILPKLEKEVEKRKKNITEVKPILEIIAIYKSQSYEQILKRTYQGTISNIKNDYHELLVLYADSKRLDNWISENIDSDMDKVVTVSEDVVSNKVSTYIQRNVHDSEFTELLSMNLMSIEDIRMKDSAMTTLEDVKLEYETKIVYQIMEYIKEANKRKIVYEEAYDKFNAELKNKNTLLDAKIAELKQQGVFAFSKKKEIKAEIEMLQKDVEEFRRTEPVQLRENYYGMYS